MNFEEIIGQKKTVSILSRALKNQRIPHALLFQGHEGVGKTATAIALAKSMLCQKSELYCDDCPDCNRVAQLSHPDLILIFPALKTAKVEEVKTIRGSISENPYLKTELWAKPSISIDTIRNLKKTVALTSFENKGRVIIVLDAHAMTTEAANSLLKILEEPPAKVTLILVTSKANQLLSTIVSRCQQLKFDPLTREEIEQALIGRNGIEAEQANVIARMSFGNYRRALELLDEGVKEKQELMIEVLRKVILSDLELMLFVEKMIDQYDVKAIKEMLVLMTVWFRDAMVCESLKNEADFQDRLINVDRLEILKKFTGSFESIDFQKIMEKIEYSIELIDRNVFLNVILFQLVFELKMLLRRKANV